MKTPKRDLDGLRHSLFADTSAFAQAQVDEQPMQNPVEPKPSNKQRIAGLLEDASWELHEAQYEDFAERAARYVEDALDLLRQEDG